MFASWIGSQDLTHILNTKSVEYKNSMRWKKAISYADLDAGKSRYQKGMN